MTDLDITRFVLAHADHMDRFSNSIAASGLQDIGARTWAASCAVMADPGEWPCSDLDAIVDWAAEFGAWERQELEAMPGDELNALLVQFIAGDYQRRADAEKRGELARWEECERGRLYTCNDRWFYYLDV